MLEITKRSPNRVDLSLSGVLGKDEMAKALDELLDAAGSVRDGKMLYRIVDFEMPTLGALAVEFMQMPQLLRLVTKFSKCAVLSDQAWIRTAAEIEGAIFPHLDIKSFTLANAQEAEDWLENVYEDDFEENMPV